MSATGAEDAPIELVRYDPRWPARFEAERALLADALRPWLTGPIDVHAERPEDRAAVRDIHLAAFDTAAEADLVDALREQARPLVSLVAQQQGRVVGHIFFSPVTLDAHPALRLMGLAPMAVAPDHQRQGIGSALVRAGLAQCRSLGATAVVVLGHPAYYPRFGFVPAAGFGIGCEYDAPPEAFMLLELQPGGLHGARGCVRYHRAFQDL